jgi:isopropylmalate/homocitrate/citramalate synthase
MFKSSQIIKNNITNCFKRKSILEKINPILFDVSLRDGIQNAKPENFPLSRKIDTFNSIINSNMVNKIEIGSLASPKLLPIMSDSLIFFNNVSTQLNNIKHKAECSRDLVDEVRIPKIYMLIPSIEKLRVALIHNIRNFSFITSVSNEFQLRNTKRTIQDKKHELKTISDILIREPGSQTFQTKLYISCINQCPFIGKIDNDFILREILNYHKDYLFDEFCLSDTMGTLNFDDFSYIIDNCIYFGIPPSKLSLHLHVKSDNLENIRDILFYSFSKNINKFDVSCLESGGSSVTMNKRLTTNLTYDMFFQMLLKYINRKIYFENL